MAFVRDWEEMIREDIQDLVDNGDWDGDPATFTDWEEWARDMWTDRRKLYDRQADHVTLIEFRGAVRAAMRVVKRRDR